MENWKPVVGFEGFYEVSDLGRIRNVRTGVLKTTTDHPKELRCTTQLWRDNRQKGCKVHRLVLLAFVGPPPTHAHECCHNDGDYRNNVLTNLRWGTSKENMADRTRHGTDNRGERCGNAKLTADQVLAIRSDDRLQKDIASEYGITPHQVSRIKSKVRWAHL